MNQQNPPQSSSSEGRADDDSALSDFLASLTDYTPTIPDELVEHYLAKSGFQCPDVRLTRLVAVATQKFVAEVAGDALQHCKARQATIPKDKRDKQQKDKRLVLTMEDLSKALREYGVNLRHQEYFADSPSTGMDPAARDEECNNCFGVQLMEWFLWSAYYSNVFSKLLKHCNCTSLTLKVIAPTVWVSDCTQS